jgi:aspartyl-tRNA(Asn)/glutamyl-tRNA(Gln) amidotransferase subunit C
MITKEDVKHISWLASIKIDENEEDEFIEQFNSILEYFQQLDEADTETIEPTYRVVDLANVFREDKALRSLSQEESLRNSPRQEAGYFRSPRIV